MGEWSSSSSDSDSDFSRRRARQRRSVNDDRGVIKREAWADASDTDTDSSSGAESDHSDDIPLAQTEMQSDASGSDDKEDANDDSDTTMDGEEETEDVDIRIKAEERQQNNSASNASENEEDGGDEEAIAEESDANVDDEEETEDVDIRIKAETPPEERSSTGEDEAAETVNDDDDQDTGEASASASFKASAPARRARSGRARSRKAIEDSGSEWEPEEDGDQDDDDEETQTEVQDDQPAKRSSTRHEFDDGEDDEAEEKDEDEEDDAPEPVGRLDFDDAQRFFVQLKRAHLPTTEGAVLWDGGSVSGPPIDRPLNQADQWKRKYRWPVAMRNVRRRNFAADAMELSEVYDVKLRHDSPDTHGPSAAAREAFAAALAPTVRPLMETVIATSREQSRKRRRETSEQPEEEEAVDLSWLRTVTRLGGHYTDQLLDSILVKNVLSLQGVDASYPQQCWDPLPTSKRPIANWRFVLEHFCKSSTHGVDAPVSSPCPKLRKDTLIRIRDRLRTLYGLSWRPEDDEFFNLVDRQELDPPDLVNEEILQL